MNAFVNRLRITPQFDKLPDIGKLKSATLIYHSQSYFDHYLETLGWTTSFTATALFLVALTAFLGVWLGMGSLTVYWKNELPN